MLDGSEGSSSREGTSRGWERIMPAPLLSWKSSGWEIAPYDSVHAPCIPGAPRRLCAPCVLTSSGRKTWRYPASHHRPLVRPNLYEIFGPPLDEGRDPRFEPLRWACFHGNGVGVERYTRLRLMPGNVPKREGYAQERCEKCLHLGGDIVSLVVRPETNHSEPNPGSMEL